MFTEKNLLEVEKQSIQNRILEILDKQHEEIKKFEIRATIPVEETKLNWHDNFLALLEPKIKDAKILDLFCGSNSIKRYLHDRRLDEDVTGVDISNKNADIKINVEEIEKVLPPKKQFNIVCSFGGVPGATNYELIGQYLKDNGFFITESSNEIFYEKIQPILENKEINSQDDFTQDAKKNFDYFQPITIIEISGIKDFISKKSFNSVYIIWRKR